MIPGSNVVSNVVFTLDSAENIFITEATNEAEFCTYGKTVLEKRIK